MDKRKCGTCRFFAESEIVGSGWCNHPQRRTSVETLLMVRKGELACRNGWDNNLWEPIEAGRGDGPSPVASDEIGPVVRPAASAVGMHDDVVVDQAPVMSDLNERTAVLAYDTRLAIDEARERHRRRAASAGSDEAWGTTAEHQAEPPAAAEPAPEQPARVSEPDAGPYVRIGDTGATGADAPVGDDPFEEIPDVRADIDLPRASRPEAPPVISLNETAATAADSAEMIEPWFANGDPRRARLLSEVLAQRAQLAKRRGHGRFGRSRPRELPLPAPLRERAAEDNGTETELPAPEHEQQYVLLRDPREQIQHNHEHIVVDDNIDGEVEVAADAELDVAEPETWHRSAEALPALDDDELLTIPTVDIAPEVPRACRTCRDFRPSDNGDRGWCTNKWAFSHRRMVNADELPCLTSVGCWWLPHDVIWLSTADVGRHSEPTPLVDRWLAERTAGEEAARPAMRRRQS